MSRALRILLSVLGLIVGLLVLIPALFMLFAIVVIL